MIDDLEGAEMKRGILLLNMGGPNNLEEVEQFLHNMFADPAILTMRPFLRKLIGKRIVTKRLSEAQESYRQIGGRSPLGTITDSLASKVAALSNTMTLPGMRYVPVFSRDSLEAMRDADIEEIILFPMYPHYSTTTTESSYQDILAQCHSLDYHPKTILIEPYHSDPGYIALVIDRIRKAVAGVDASEYSLIFSVHGLPMSIIEAGDPYREQVEASFAEITQALSEASLAFKAIELAYQSKVGGGAWLEPSLADVLRRPSSLKTLIVPLAFTVDNSETHYELDIEHREIATKIGYEDYRVAECPNDHDDFTQFIAAKVNNAIRQ